METELHLRGPLQASLMSALSELVWYVLLASAASLIFYVLFRAALRHRRILRRDPTTRQVWREVVYSVRSIAIFGVVTYLVVFAARAGWTRLYYRVEAHGWLWLVVSIAVMIVIHDTYFYWTHRLMHHHRLYHFFHHTHHLSTSPTPWAAYAFSPAEAFVQAGIGPLVVFTVPSHPVAFATFMIWQITFNVLGHCGYEIMPGWFLRTPAGSLLNTVTHHALHHEKFRANFGLYFNVWDRLMGTNHRDYESRFVEATGSRDSDPQPAAQAMISEMRCPCTSVKRRSMPL